MEFRILGPLEVIDAGRSVVLGNRERALLAILLLSANHVVPSERLVEDLWAGRPPEGAKRALRVYMSRLRKALGDTAGDGILVTRPPGYLLRVDPEGLDAARFEVLLAQGRQQAACGNHQEAAKTLGRALDLWRGPVLADLADTPFTRVDAVRLEEARLTALEDRLDADLVCGRHGEVLPELDALTRAHPLRERLWGQRMLALYRAGRQAEALRSYQELRQLLGEELGLEPSVNVRRLEAAILRQDPELDWSPPAPAGPARMAAGSVLPLPPALAVEPASPFVSRSAEMELGGQLLDDPTRNRLGVLWLLGEPGIGKSRLAREIARRAHDRGAVVVFGCCSEDLSVPYQPFLEALRWFVAHIPNHDLPARLGLFAGELTRLVPEVGTRLPGLEASRSTSPEVEQYHLFEAVRSWLAAAGVGRPLVVILDDVHWADRPTLALLGHVARSAEESRALLICTARTTSPDDNEALAAVADDLDRRHVPGQRVELRGLDVNAVGELVESAAGRSLDDGLRTLAAELQGETAGNPLFVDALLASLPAPDVWRPGELPRTLAETVTRRVARLPAEVGELLRVASVAGLDFDLRVVARAAGQDELEALDAFDRAANAGLVEEAGANRYRFAHALVRSALRGELSQPRRVRVHLGIGAALEAVHGEGSEEHASELAHHFFEAVPAGGGAKAYHYAVQAAQRATRLQSHHEAADAYGRAVALLDEAPADDDPLRGCALLLGRGQAQFRAGEVQAGRATLRQTAEEAAVRGSAEYLARAAVAFDQAGTELGISGADSLELLQGAEAALPPEETPLRALTVAALARALGFSGHRAQSMIRGEDALAAARRLGDPATIGQVLLRTSYIYRTVDEAPEYARRGAELIELVRRHGDEELYLLSSFVHAEANAMLGDLTTWDALAPDQLRLLDMIRQPYCEHNVVLRQHTRAELAGDLARAEQLLARAEEIGRAMGWGFEGLYGLATFLLRRQQGRLIGLGPTLRSVVQRNPPADLWNPGVAALYVELGLFEEAHETFEGLAADGFATLRDDGTRYLCLGLLAEVCATLGDRARAPWLLEQLRRCEGRLLLFPAMSACLGPADRLLAKLAAVAGDDHGAARWHERALAMSRGLPSPLWTAHCLVDSALHLRDRDPIIARDMLEEATALCQRHALAGLARQVASVLAD